jgi:hypothetical protein
MNVLNIVDWIAIIFFGGSMLIIALTAFIIFSIVSLNSNTSKS